MMASLASWGNYPHAPQSGRPCHWQADIRPQWQHLIESHGTTLPFGNGRSYGDSCMAASDHVLQLRPLNRFIEADWENGEICAEAGVTLGEILQLAIPRGWFLRVTPGTRHVTLGGAVANDVHGKNHHRCGTFAHSLVCFELHRSVQSPMVCSLRENPQWFAATIGGLGLTGVITWVRIRLRKIQSSLIDSTRVRFDCLDDFFALSADMDAQHEYSVAWIDCLAKGNALGRGCFTAGDHCVAGPLEVAAPRSLSVPIRPPVSLINSLTLKLFNDHYWKRQPANGQHQKVGYSSFFYPLDRIENWNRIYGRRGFQQFQCVLPASVAAVALAELLKSIARSGSGSFLAVLKRCGDIPSPGWLSFPMPGTSLALDFPHDIDLPKKLLPRLGAIVREAGGRLYPAKDAHMSGSDFRQAYPAWEQLEAMRDPTLMSRFWQRVTR
ncbi:MULTISPECIES: FAD-binding oxidoreductase [Pseudomonas]|jgi:FAD/FMN-containing dehydrogenase|uniref:FAD-binding oxidoreductase n=1 Tax=Pseudomonas TaxID=286 RepID=UPI000D80E7A0|nr:FAD-binding oxidoreductase [Pseudomonas moraviensis]PYB96909.1 FAD-binding oxidoreductase [Pseudomonas koreensis]RRW57834.1 FAD-binding oxidoreductase [Pseudomonas moraviensis]